MKFQLYADVADEQFFRRVMHELGNVFYRCIDKEKGEYEIVYFSGSRLARFVGEPSANFMEIVKATGVEVDLIEIDEIAGTLKVVKKGKSERR